MDYNTYDNMLKALRHANSVGAEILERTMIRVRDDLNTYELRFGHLGPEDLEGCREINENVAKETVALWSYRFYAGEVTLTPEFVREHAWSGEYWSVGECLKALP